MEHFYEDDQMDNLHEVGRDVEDEYIVRPNEHDDWENLDEVGEKNGGGDDANEAHVKYTSNKSINTNRRRQGPYLWMNVFSWCFGSGESCSCSTLTSAPEFND
ncbi:hypothetical protein OGAPHI_004087 [Ogataea philodendri]|uniref:Uncharacterized protein n=1 Tax=Ogataea philodendri TaxID=1378263 RepID=A0A9P8T4F3_9ASCO|nr:uncharacterized protein OGAPHI_004087 [Ogataea philodendri]KAH3665898.1 hypothetical protein OGAPHI_004087 [Ogataea philodendri]